jgi:Trypsin
MRKAMIAAVAAAIAFAPTTLLAGPLVAAPVAHAQTGADWAWPGMEYDIYKAGVWIDGCSVGFPAWNDAGTRYFISAGHCFRSESGTHYQEPGGAGVEVYSPSDHNTAVGFERTYTIPNAGRYDDVSLVEMDPGKKLYGNGWQHIPDNPVNAAVGDGACLVGSRHTTANCGAVTATGVRQTPNGYPWMEDDIATASYCAHPGDSGGAVYNSSGALGIQITAYEAHNDPGTPGACSSQFIPIERVLEILRKTNPSLTI